MRRPALIVALFLLATGSFSGCSFIFVEPLADHHHPGDRTECTSSPTSPIVDSAFALGYVGSAAYIGTRDNVSNKAPAVALALVDAAVTLSSAIYGYVETDACRVAKRDSETPLPFRGLGTTPFIGGPSPVPVVPSAAPPPTLAPGEAPRM
jgi:hypothetical protein